LSKAATGIGTAEPPADCPICPRLVGYRHDIKIRHPGWHNAPVASFGDTGGRLLIVGLAPGLKGANRTGRPFTGDYAGDLLYKTLISHGFARGTYDARPDDGLELTDCLITNAVRCLPPQNKPTGAEITACRPFLLATMAAMPNLGAVLALGRIAHETFLTTVGARRAAHSFGHNVTHRLERLTLFDSYHCSRYNTNTGRLTEAMFNDVFDAIDRFLERRGS